VKTALWTKSARRFSLPQNGGSLGGSEAFQMVKLIKATKSPKNAPARRRSTRENGDVLGVVEAVNFGLGI
jgi:hypothetical protein